MKVKDLIKALQALSAKLGEDTPVHIYEHGSVYDCKVLGVNQDEYDRKQGKNSIKISVGA